MFKKLFKKKRYFDCRWFKHSIHFFYDEIRACCSNVPGPVFYSDINEKIKVDLDYIYQQRQKYIKEINSTFHKEDIPVCCQNCVGNPWTLGYDKIKTPENIIDKVYIQNNMSCNAKCIYCTFRNFQGRYKYAVLPVIKEMTEKKILSPNASVYMSGGEITISPEFEELLSTLLNYLNGKIEILTSGIKYCKSIEEAFIRDKCSLIISLDSACSETYKKIKQVDCFDKVVENIRNYVKASENAKTNLVLKYIIVDDINDNIEEIFDFVKLVSELQIKKIRLDFDYEKYKFSGDKKIPSHYIELYKKFNEEALKSGLDIQKCTQVDAILNQRLLSEKTVRTKNHDKPKV